MGNSIFGNNHPNIWIQFPFLQAMQYRIGDHCSKRRFARQRNAEKNESYACYDSERKGETTDLFSAKYVKWV